MIRALLVVGASANTNLFNQYFGFSRYTGKSYYGGHFGANNDNHYELFTASGIDFLVISMEYDANRLQQYLIGQLHYVKPIITGK